MSEKRTKILTGLKLQPESKFNPFFAGLQAYLRSKLQMIQVDGCSHYSCGVSYHHWSIPTWKPFDNFEEYCLEKGFDDFAVLALIEEKLGKKIICECQIINDVEADRRARLQKSFGVDLGESVRNA